MINLLEKYSIAELRMSDQEYYEKVIMPEVHDEDREVLMDCG